MAAPLELNFNQLAQIALGGPQFDKLSISALHTLIELILKKLKCENEVVEFKGLQAKCVSDIYYQSKPSDIKFTEISIKKTPDFHEILKLEKNVDKLENDLEQHFNGIRRAHKVDKTLNWRYWEKYATKMEFICEVGDPEFITACELLRNQVFIHRIKHLCCEPLIERISQIERRVIQLFAELTHLNMQTKKHLGTVSFLESLIYEIQDSRSKVIENFKTFEIAMKELQQMLMRKLDKLHIPPMRRAAKEHISMIESKIDEIVKKQINSLYTKYKVSGNVCLACDSNIAKVLQEQMCTEAIVETELKPCNCRPGPPPEGYDLLQRIERIKKIQIENINLNIANQCRTKSVRFSYVPEIVTNDIMNSF